MTTTDLPASLISTLPGQYYTDPAIFALEQSKIFENMWFGAVRSSDLPTPGSFKKIQVGRESVLVVRGRAEQPSVLQEAGGADVVTSRAVAPLAKLAKWSLPLVHEGGRMLALKGSSAQEEIDRDRDELTRMGAGNLEVLECGGDLLPTPTIVVKAERIPRPARRRKKR